LIDINPADKNAGKKKNVYDGGKVKALEIYLFYEPSLIYGKINRNKKLGNII
jgi:hypothetical protein